MTIFHERFKALRDIAEKKQAQIADELGMTPQAFSYYVNGREPNYDTLVKIAGYFGVTTDYLLGLSDYKTSDNNVIAQQIPLSDKAIDFLKECPMELRPTVDMFLSDKNANDFFLELMTYIYTIDDNSEAKFMAAQKAYSGTSKVPPQFLKLIPLLQQTRLVDSVNHIANSIKLRGADKGDCNGDSDKEEK